MTFLEAIKTGRPMRRASWWGGHPAGRWLVLDPEGYWRWNGGGEARPPDRVDYLADDWEVAP